MFSFHSLYKGHFGLVWCHFSCVRAAHRSALAGAGSSWIDRAGSFSSDQGGCAANGKCLTFFLVLHSELFLFPDIEQNQCCCALAPLCHAEYRQLERVQWNSTTHISGPWKFGYIGATTILLILSLGDVAGAAFSIFCPTTIFIFPEKKLNFFLRFLAKKLSLGSKIDFRRIKKSVSPDFFFGRKSIFPVFRPKKAQNHPKMIENGPKMVQNRSKRVDNDEKTTFKSHLDLHKVHKNTQNPLRMLPGAPTYCTRL